MNPLTQESVFDTTAERLRSESGRKSFAEGCLIGVLDEHVDLVVFQVLVCVRGAIIRCYSRHFESGRVRRSHDLRAAVGGGPACSGRSSLRVYRLSGLGLGCPSGNVPSKIFSEPPVVWPFSNARPGCRGSSSVLCLGNTPGLAVGLLRSLHWSGYSFGQPWATECVHEHSHGLGQALDVPDENFCLHKFALCSRALPTLRSPGAL
ncbi:hypothetical protein TIFTF001_036133 [Ficus carica]|uniref:Uncharacterized protein n=1 Tax=Ficus carica TaxID=3494 RepID=A0AA88JCG4_FICCA|nr:hypothetical protein TIFTF001_036133 [Ficus carica]